MFQREIGEHLELLYALNKGYSDQERTSRLPHWLDRQNVVMLFDHQSNKCNSQFDSLLWHGPQSKNYFADGRHLHAHNNFRKLDKTLIKQTSELDSSCTYFAFNGDINREQPRSKKSYSIPLISN